MKRVVAGAAAALMVAGGGAYGVTQYGTGGDVEVVDLRGSAGSTRLDQAEPSDPAVEKPEASGTNPYGPKREPDGNPVQVAPGGGTPTVPPRERLTLAPNATPTPGQPRMLTLADMYPGHTWLPMDQIEIDSLLESERTVCRSGVVEPTFDAPREATGFRVDAGSASGFVLGAAYWMGTPEAAKRALVQARRFAAECGTAPLPNPNYRLKVTDLPVSQPLGPDSVSLSYEVVPADGDGFKGAINYTAVGPRLFVTNELTGDDWRGNVDFHTLQMLGKAT